MTQKRIFESFFVCEYDFEVKKEPIVQFLFPNQKLNEKCNHSPEKLKHFCFPEVNRTAVQLEKEKENFTFVLTENKGDLLYGNCCRINRSSSSSISFCIMSRCLWDFFFREVLLVAEMRYSISMESLLIFLEALYIKSLPKPFSSLQLCIPLHTSKVDNKRNTLTHMFRRNDDENWPDISMIYDKLDGEQIHVAFVSLLLERHVMIVGDDLDYVGECVRCLREMLHPFDWVHIFIPILPKNMLDFINAPMPYLVGIHSSCLPLVEALQNEDIVVVKLESKEVTFFPEDLNLFPAPLSSLLLRHQHKELSRWKKIREANYSSTTCTTTSTSTSTTTEDSSPSSSLTSSPSAAAAASSSSFSPSFRNILSINNIQKMHEGFLKCFIRMFGEMHKYYDPFLHKFDYESFYGVQNTSIQAFLDIFSLSQQFEQYVQQWELKAETKTKPNPLKNSKEGRYSELLSKISQTKLNSMKNSFNRMKKMIIGEQDDSQQCVMDAAVDVIRHLSAIKDLNLSTSPTSSPAPTEEKIQQIPPKIPPRPKGLTIIGLENKSKNELEGSSWKKCTRKEVIVDGDICKKFQDFAPLKNRQSTRVIVREASSKCLLSGDVIMSGNSSNISNKKNWKRYSMMDVFGYNEVMKGSQSLVGNSLTIFGTSSSSSSHKKDINNSSSILPPQLPSKQNLVLGERRARRNTNLSSSEAKMKRGAQVFHTPIPVPVPNPVTDQQGKLRPPPPIPSRENRSSLQREKLFLRKLNLILVQVIKHEWPHNWPTFLPEVIGASRTSESICENNMHILQLLSEEVFDFSSGQMTQAKIKELKNSFNREFAHVYELCDYVLQNSQKSSLLLATLDTLLRFLNWIPIGYIFETKLIEMLITKFFGEVPLRNVVLQCLGEIGSLEIGSIQDNAFSQMFSLFLTHLKMILPQNLDFARSFNESQFEHERRFINHLALFFSGFFKAHIGVIERDHPQLIIDALRYLVEISKVQDKEIFKVCVEYWYLLTSELYQELPSARPNFLLQMTPAATTPRRDMYSPILHDVREVLINNMAKPEEVLIVEDENGDITRVFVKDSEQSALYKIMRETLVFLTHLDYKDTQGIMIQKLQTQVDGTEWSRQKLNTLCWAIGSAAGAVSEELEKRFMVFVITRLLGLCENKREKDNKAVIASNILYIVGQYPRFLRAHWKFLKTVVNKLFEFMHETHPGVQDMACDTFHKITLKCRRKFVIVNTGEQGPFIETILGSFPDIICDLEPQQVHHFYEVVSLIIAAFPNPQEREALIAKQMWMVNQLWGEIMAQAARDVSYLQGPEVIKNLSNILKINVACAKSLGQSFSPQLGRIFLDMLNVYQVYSEAISILVSRNGPTATSTTAVRAMRSTKQEALRLIETFVQRCSGVQMVLQNFVPPILEAVLVDYKKSIALARDAQVLSMMTVIVNRLKAAMVPDIPRVLENVFESTLDIITENFEDYPDHRIHFYALIKSIVNHCFIAFFSLTQTQFKLIMHSIVWAFKHSERSIADTGLDILLALLKNISTSEDIANGFYQNYALNLIQDIFVVLTDTFHKSGFKLHATILMHLFNSVESGVVKVPLWDTTAQQDPQMTNQLFLRDYVINLLSTAFTNLTKNQVQQFVHGLFDLNKDNVSFKNHLRDFLVQLKEFQTEDNADLYREEFELEQKRIIDEETKIKMSIPGMIKQTDQIEDEMND